MRTPLIESKEGKKLRVALASSAEELKALVRAPEESAAKPLTKKQAQTINRLIEKIYSVENLGLRERLSRRYSERIAMLKSLKKTIDDTIKSFNLEGNYVPKTAQRQVISTTKSDEVAEEKKTKVKSRPQERSSDAKDLEIIPMVRKAGEETVADKINEVLGVAAGKRAESPAANVDAEKGKIKVLLGINGKYSLSSGSDIKGFFDDIKINCPGLITETNVRSGGSHKILMVTGGSGAVYSISIGGDKDGPKRNQRLFAINVIAQELGLGVKMHGNFRSADGKRVDYEVIREVVGISISL